MELASYVFVASKPPMPGWLLAGAIASQMLLLLMTTYHVVLMPAGLRVRRPAAAPPRRSFAILVPAHNEEAVIGELVANLGELRYPRALYDVFVVADNCTDGTAAVARARGAEVFERRDPARRGKQYAIAYALQRLWALPRRYDAVVILDADNLVAADFLLAMNARLEAGEEVIQGYLDVKNPGDTWVSAAFAFSYWVSNRFWCLAKHNLGFTVPLGGTGMCIATETLRRVGWGTDTLTEDLEFTMRALLHGVRTTWAHEAVVYDEKPLTLAQSWRQRLRWVQGAVQVAGRYLGPLLAEAVRRRDPVFLEAAVMICRPFYVSAALALGGLTFLAGFRYDATHLYILRVPEPLWAALACFQYLLPVVAVWLDRVPLRPYRFLPLFPLFAYTWLPITLLGVVRAQGREWVPTRHTRAISYRDLAQQRLSPSG